MKNIYHIHKSSNSYWNNEWYYTDYYLCDSIEEYDTIMARKKAKLESIPDIYKDRFKLSEEKKVIASEYYYGHEWQGKNFSAVGFSWYERLERSTHTEYYLKPGSVSDIVECKDPGIGWMYGS